MSWFERLTGFHEETGPDGYRATQSRLAVEGPFLRSKVNGRRYRIGALELVSLESLRERAQAGPPTDGAPTLRLIEAEAGALHQSMENAGALFQVASQFNLLEMVDPHVEPEDGVARYAHDRTQGPACAIAAGAATLYRNYFADLGTSIGQTRTQQLDGFADLGDDLARGIQASPESLWRMSNGYALFSAGAVDRISSHIDGLDPAGRDALRRRLKIGVHWDVEVTTAPTTPGPTVSQAFCSALPIAYHREANFRTAHWAPLAKLVLEAAYEATLWSAVLNAQRGASRRVFLTSLGGGAFGNEEGWILGAMDHALEAVASHGIAVDLVSFGRPSREMERWAAARSALRTRARDNLIRMAESSCPFCTPPEERVFYQNDLILGLWDGFPINPGHALLVPRRHVATWEEATPEEQRSLTTAVVTAQQEIRKHHRPDGFNVGMNLGPAAGQTVPHLHLHVIPRYLGDVPDPRGGVRWVVPDRADYWSARRS